MSVEDEFRATFPDADPAWSAFGVDVSGWQDPDVVSRLADQRLNLVIVKVSEGPSYRSAEAVTQASDAVNLGIPLGVYHFVTFVGVEVETANLLGALAGVQRPTMQDRGFAAGIWLDAEDTYVGRHFVPDGYGDYLERLAVAVEAASGIPVGIYTAAWWSDGRIPAGSAVCARPLWVADYDDGRVWPGYPNPKLPDGWPSAVGWQYTSRTASYGPLDLNAFRVSPAPVTQPPAETPAAPAVPLHERWLYVDTPYLWGEDVERLQAALVAMGYNPGLVDGIYGPRTETAVIAYQLDRTLVADGIVGPATFAALDGGR